MENKITFVRKIKLSVINDNIDIRNQEYQKLRDIQYHTWKLANKIVQGQLTLKTLPEIILYKYPEKYTRYKEIQNKILEFSTIKKKTQEDKDKLKILYTEAKSIVDECEEEMNQYIRSQSIQNYTYGKNADEYYDLIPSTVRTTLNQKVFKEFNEKLKSYLRGEESIQTYKKTIPVPFQASAISNLSKNENGSFTFTLFKINLECHLGKDGNNTKHILESLIANDGKFKLCDSSYQFKEKDFFLLLTVSTEQTKTKKNSNMVAGVDLGVSRMATLIIRDISDCNKVNYIERKFFGDISLMKKMIHYNNEKSNLNRYLLGKTGKGRLHAVKKKNNQLNKFSNFRDNYNKKIAHKIIMRCITNNVSTIVLEELSGIGNSNFFLKNWPYFDLQTKIKIKAKEYGIDVLLVDRAYTSQTCPKCGYVHRDNRQQQKEFSCTNPTIKCDYKANADVTAAINLTAKINKEKI